MTWAVFKTDMFCRYLTYFNFLFYLGVICPQVLLQRKS